MNGVEYAYGHGVAGSEHRRRRLRKVEQTLHRLERRCLLEKPLDHELRLNRDPVLQEGLLVAVASCQRGLHLELPVDQSDPTMTELDQMRHGLVRALTIVDVHPGNVGEVRMASNEHQRTAVLDE